MRVRHTVRDESGSGLIEMAVTLPVFLLLVFGLINFALVVFGVCNMTYASEIALRYACVHSSTSYTPSVSTDFTNIIQPFLFKYPANTSTVKVSYSNGNTVGSTATVAVTVTYTIVLPGYTYSGLALSTSTKGIVVQ